MTLAPGDRERPMKRWLRTLAIACMATAVFLFPPTLLWLPWLAPQQALAETIWGDDLVSFEFSSPATRVILDGEPLAILPETLAVDVSYYDAEGQLVERTIPYDFDKGGSNAQWNDLAPLLDDTFRELAPRQDGETGAWYFEVGGERMDVPMKDIAVSSADVTEHTVVGTNGDWSSSPDLPPGSLKVHKFVTDRSMMWTWLNDGEACDAVLVRGTKAGVCAFSKRDQTTDLFMDCTEANEPYYLCIYNTGKTYPKGFSFMCMQSPLYKRTGDKAQSYVMSLSQESPGNYFCFSVDVAEAGWYQLRFSDFNNFSTRPTVTAYASQPQSERTWTEDVFYTVNSDHTEPLWLEPGTVFFFGHTFTNALQGSYSEAYMKYTLTRLEEGYFVPANLSVEAPKDDEDGYWNVDSEEEGTPVRCIPADENFLPKYSPAKITGREGESYLRLYGELFLTSADSEPFGNFSVWLEDMMLTSDTELSYEPIVGARVVLQLLDSRGNLLDLTSTDILKEGNYVIRVTTFSGGEQVGQRDWDLVLPEIFEYEIVSPDDLKVSFGDMGDSGFAVSHPSEDVWKLSKEEAEYIDMYYDILSRMTVAATMTDKRTGKTVEVDFSCSIDKMPYDDGSRYPGIGENGEHDFVRYTMYEIEGDEETEVPLEIDRLGEYRLAISTAVNGFEKSVYISATSQDYEYQKNGIPVPTATSGLVFNGDWQIGVLENDYVRVVNNEYMDAGSYVATAQLIDPWTYTWSDGTTEDKQIAWSIAPKSLSGFKVAIKDVTYDGTPWFPILTITDGSLELSDGVDYTASCASSCKNVGTYKATIKGIDNYTGSMAVSFKVNPKGTKLSKLTPGKKRLKVAWKKQAAKMSTSTITGYQIQYATSASFKGAKTVTVKGFKSTSKTISKLKSGKKYYVRVRTYKTVGRTKHYSAWSTKKAAKVK